MFLTSAGRLFHSFGAADWKAWSLRVGRHRALAGTNLEQSCIPGPKIISWLGSDSNFIFDHEPNWCLTWRREHWIDFTVAGKNFHVIDTNGKFINTVCETSEHDLRLNTLNQLIAKACLFALVFKNASQTICSLTLFVTFESSVSVHETWASNQVSPW